MFCWRGYTTERGATELPYSASLVSGSLLLLNPLEDAETPVSLFRSLVCPMLLAVSHAPKR